MQKSSLINSIMKNINKSLFPLNEALSEDEIAIKRENLIQKAFNNFIRTAKDTILSYSTWDNSWKDPFSDYTHGRSYYDNEEAGFKGMMKYFFKNQINSEKIPSFYDEKTKMRNYQSKGSDPERIAKACQNNICKLIMRYIIANEINWKAAEEAFYPYVFKLVSELPEFTNFIDRSIKADINFENDVDQTDTTQYAPTARDWSKMIDYMNRKSDPQRLAQSCKDNNKIVARYIIAKAMKWAAAEKEFKNRALELGILSAPQLEAYARTYATYNAPDEYKNLIDELIQNDAKGGIAQNANGKMLYMDEFDKCSAIKSYEIEPDPSSQYKLWKITTYNDTVYYCRLITNFSQLKVSCTLYDENKNVIDTEYFGPQSYYGHRYGQKPMTKGEYMKEVVEYLNNNLN